MKSFVRQFEAQVERTPDALAVQTDDVQFTYREFNQHANRLARYFRSLGVTQETLVGVGLPRSAETLATLLGVWKAGGAFLPLDPQYPAERLAFMLRDAGASLLITQSQLLPKLAAAFEPSAPHRTVCLDTEQAFIAQQDARNPESTCAADALAYLIYTSGSTGKPKGVTIAHANVNHYAPAMAQALGILPGDRYLHTASFSFSSSIRQFAVPLSCGACVSIASTQEIRDPQQLFETIRRREVTVLDFVPSFSEGCLQVLMSLDASTRTALLDNRVRLMLSASEPLPTASVQRWRRLVRPATTLINMYGQTETTGIVMTYPIPDGGDATAIVPIGKPIAGTQVHLLDESLNPVQAGGSGELYVSGASVGRGYLDSPEATAQNFVPNSFDAGARLFRTGDTARRRADGVFEFIGRCDEQLKIRGFRIEPGEIEAVIRTHPAVRECKVSAVGEELKQLAAFVAGDGLEDTGLREYLKDKLPDYMLPQRIVMLARLPRAPNGKIDRQALFATVQSTPAVEHDTERDSPISRLIAIWEDTLGRKGIRPEDDFFDLGGTSLIAVTLMLAVRQRFGKVLPLATLFEARTVGKLAALLTAEQEHKEWSPLVSIQPNGARTPLFCIHPGGGNVLGYNEFIAHLDADQPVYGIQAYGVIEGQAPQVSIPEMAARYIGAIRKVRPHGPYALGGESFGGLVAYEVACQLVETGEPVEFVFVSDAWPAPSAAQLRSWRYRIARFTYPFTLRWTQWRDLIDKKLGRKPARVITRRYLYANELHKRMSLAHRQASRNFTPRPYPGRLTLFRALDCNHSTRCLQRFYGDPRMSWPSFVRGAVEVHWMSGWHGDMMHNEHAEGFAHTLQDCLNRAHTESSRV